MRLAQTVPPMMLLVAASLAGCVDEKKIVAAVEGCPKAVARLGEGYSLGRATKVGSPGVDNPPREGCSHRVRVTTAQGRAAELWLNEKDPSSCYHLYTPTGQTEDVGNGNLRVYRAVTDLRDCSETLE